MLWFSCFLGFSLFYFLCTKSILLRIIKCRNATCSKRYLTWKRDLNIISIVCSAEDDFEMTGLQSDGNLDIYGFSLGMQMTKTSLVCILLERHGFSKNKTA